METPATRDWGSFKSYAEANAPRDDKPRYVTPPEDGGYVLRIDDMTDPALSPFENRSKKTNELLPPSYQTNVTFTIVDYPNDDPDESVIGQAIRMYYTISLYTGSGFYKLAKAAMGGELSPDWKPNVADMKGKLVTASLVHKEKKGDSETVYARVDSVTAYRGRKKDFGTVKENQRWLSKDEWEAQNNTNGNTSTDDVPF